MILLPQGIARAANNSRAIKAAFYGRTVALYREERWIGRLVNGRPTASTLTIPLMDVFAYPPKKAYFKNAPLTCANWDQACPREQNTHNVGQKCPRQKFTIGFTIKIKE